jgi:hypothetical protein
MAIDRQRELLEKQKQFMLGGRERSIHAQKNLYII